MNLLGQILRKSNRQSDKLSILTGATHETFETALSLTGHNFYCLYNPIWKVWNETFRKCPPNYILLKDGEIPIELDIDVIISQQKVGQHQYLYPLSRQYNIPLIQIEHTAPAPWYTKKEMRQIKEMRGDRNIFITDWSRDSWGWNENDGITIRHGIDSNIFKPDTNIEKKPYILTVCNQFSKKVREWCCGFKLWEQIIQPNTKESLPWKHVCDDKGFSLPAKNLQELIKEYQSAQIFLNTSLLSPVPMVLLESASVGCAIVSTKNCETPNIFTHGENALLSNDPLELRGFCIELLKNKLLRERLGAAARQLIIEKFPIDKFVNSWNQVLRSV